MTMKTDNGNEPSQESENLNSPHNMLDLSDNLQLKSPVDLSLFKIAESLTKSQREKIISGYDIKNLAKIFEDADVMHAIDEFLNCGMNVCKAARALYMHRNTLNYRLSSIRRRTGLDMRSFDNAVTFKFLHILYLMK